MSQGLQLKEGTEPRKGSYDTLEARKDKEDFALASTGRAVQSECWAQLSKTDSEIKKFIFVYGIYQNGLQVVVQLCQR